MALNEDHDPGNAEKQVLTVFKQEIEEYGESRMSPKLIRQRLDADGVEVTKQNVNYALGQLTAAGWVKRVTDGLYEFVEDPREGQQTEATGDTPRGSNG